MFHLQAIVDGRPAVLALKSGTNRIGRGPHNDIILLDRSLSREHAEILVEKEQVTIQDLGSSNGTRVNGNLIRGPTTIRPGDSIRCGHQEILLRPGPASVETLRSGRVMDSTVAPLADPTDVTTGEGLNVEEARQHLKISTAVAHALLSAVTEAGQLLVAAGPLEDVFERVLDLVTRVVPARRVLLLTSGTTGGEPVVRAARPPEEVLARRLVLSRTIVATVMEERRSLLLNDALHDPRFAGKDSVIGQNLRSAMVAPLFDNQKVIGLLYADTDALESAYDRDHLRAFTLLANLIAIKITNTHLLEAQRDKERMEQELAAAVQVQKSMLPARLPAVAGYALAARQVPCEQVAGDLYDVTRLEDGRVALVLGDVSGKGMGAALLMSNVMACLRVLYQEQLPLGTLVERLHKELFQSSDESYFVTAFLGMLDPRTHRLEYVNAGHNAPFLLDSGGGQRTLPATGVPLGLLDGSTWEVESVEIPPGALLCVFSDGIPEARIGSEFYGDERLLESVVERRSQPLESVGEGILFDLCHFLGECRPGDDITLLLARREE